MALYINRSINNHKEQKGITLSELLIVITIIGLLAAIAIPGYIGMQERGRRDAVTRVFEGSTSELQSLMTAARKGAATHPQSGVAEVDMDGDGIVEAAETNLALATAGVVTHFIAAQTALNQVTPWNAALPLYASGGATATQAACDSAGEAGQITLCFSPAENQTIQVIFVSVKDNDENVIYTKTVTAQEEIKNRL